LELVTAERDCLGSECNELTEKVGDLHLQLEGMKQDVEIVTESSHLQVIEILRAAIGLKANAGGAIKKEIKQALDLLDPKTPTK
jgi:regulator of replication initiation timing